MRIIVDEMPKDSVQCPLSWKHVEYARRFCKNGGYCKLENGLKCDLLRALDDAERKEVAE